jgi:hypothetical protein
MDSSGKGILMYTTPFASLRVPAVDDENMRQGLIDLATDIQYKCDRNLARLTELRRRRGAGVVSNSGIAVASGAVVTVAFNQERWDSDGYFDPGSNTIVTLTRGLWLVNATASFSGSGTLSWSLFDVAGSVYGNVIGKQNGPFATGITSLTWLAATGLFYSTGETLTMHVLQSSGGAGTLSSASLTVMKIGNL